MSTNTPSILLADADVLIDYVKTDLSIIRLVSKHIGRVHVLAEVLDTVEGLSRTSCNRYQLTIIEAETSLLLSAGERGASLSFEDWLCFLACQANGWSCVTNDRALIRVCEQNDVSYRRGLGLMIELVRNGYLTKSNASQIARAIQATNPHHINESVLSEFDKLLGLQSDPN